MERLEKRVGKKESGRELGAFLAKEMGLSKRLIRRLKQDSDGIMVNGRRCTVRYLLSPGELVSVRTSPNRPMSMLPENQFLDVVYEDEALLLAFKPRGVTMYPRYRGERGAFSGAVLGHLQRRGERLGYYPIYRLDKGTSGLVLVAKSGFIAQRLNHRPPQKLYQAIAFGLTATRGELTWPLASANKNLQHAGMLFAPHLGGKACHTVYRRLFVDENLGVSGVLVYLPTGRRHQIRAHFAHAGHPLIGDTAYGGPEHFVAAPLLHVGYLTLTHPLTGELLHFFQPMSEWMGKSHDYFGEEERHVDFLTECLSRSIKNAK